MKYNRHKSKLAILFLLVTAMLVSGCVGVGLRNGMTEEKSYEKLLREIPSISQGYGRLFIYSPKGGPSYPLNSMGDIDFFSVDKTVYRFGGESYFYLDVESGQHLLTVTKVLERGFASNKKQFGKNKLDINIESQQVIYIRFVNQSKSKSIHERTYSIDVVDKSTAEVEIASLALWNNFETTMEIE